VVAVVVDQRSQSAQQLRVALGAEGSGEAPLGDPGPLDETFGDAGTVPKH
jgi:hypothetical protein